MPTQLQSPPQPPARPRGAGADVELESVGRTYHRDGGTVRALEGVSLRARADELVALVGPSGCGKTTLLELICALQRPDIGSLRSPPAVLMPQHDLLLPWLDASTTPPWR